MGYRRPSRQTSRCWCSWSLSPGRSRLAERQSGYVVMLLVGLFAAAMPVIHMRGAHYGEIARSAGGFLRLDALGARRTRGASLSSCRREDYGVCDRCSLRSSMLLPIHIAAGGLAIVLGAVALSVKKGGTLHRRSGCCSSTPCSSWASAPRSWGFARSHRRNVFAGFLTAYFVVTALTTVRPVSSWTRRLDVVALTVAVALASSRSSSAWRPSTARAGFLDGVPLRA